MKSGEGREVKRRGAEGSEGKGKGREGKGMEGKGMEGKGRKGGDFYNPSCSPTASSVS